MISDPFGDNWPDEITLNDSAIRERSIFLIQLSALSIYVITPQPELQIKPLDRDRDTDSEYVYASLGKLTLR